MDTQYPPDAWRRLGKALEDIRGGQGYGYRRRAAFLKDRGSLVSSKTLARIEAGTGVEEATLAVVATVHGLTPAAARQILAGAPEETASPAATGDPGALMRWVAVRARERGCTVDEIGGFAGRSGLARYTADRIADESAYPLPDLGIIREIAGFLGMDAVSVLTESGLIPDDGSPGGADGERSARLRLASRPG